MNARRLVRLVLVVAALVVVLPAHAASAHPLGNFTINRYARLEVSAGVVRVYYVLDEAEIPTFQDRDTLHANRDAFIRQHTQRIADNLTLRVDDHSEPLVAISQQLTLPAGQAGLPTLRLAILFEARLTRTEPQRPRAVVFADRNEPDRIGWREIVVTATGDARITQSNAPSRDLSDELRHYPANLIQAPLDLRNVTFAYRPGTVTAAVRPFVAPKAVPRRAGSGFTHLIQRQGVTPAVFFGMLGIALLFGAGHALAPGHGKTIMAAYLVGTEGRPVDALLIGLIVSAMHTASVLVLAFVLFRVGPSTSIERVYPLLTLASGLAVIAVGAWLLITRWRRLQHQHATLNHHMTEPHDTDAARRHPHPLPSHDHHHDHDPYEPEHAPRPAPPQVLVPQPHPHGDQQPHQHPQGTTNRHDHRHTHGELAHTHELPDGVAPLSRRGLVVLATSGGILPSPSAVIVLVAAFTAGRAALGLLLVAAFSVGLAATLTAVGLALVVGGRLATTRFNTRIVPVLPLLGAAAVFILGVIISAQGIRTLR